MSSVEGLSLVRALWPYKCSAFSYLVDGTYHEHSFSPQRKQCHTEKTSTLIQSILSLLGFLAFPSEIILESHFSPL